VQCDKCGKLKSKHNINRHTSSCKGRVLVDVEPNTPTRSEQQSSSGLLATAKDDGHSPSATPTYTPPAMGAVLSSLIMEVVPAILDQHDRYDLLQLSEYVGNYYPDMPQSLREPVILATVTAARRAALFHNIVEKNVGSRDNSKREFAAEAASALSFWALGLRPAHRSTEAQSDRSGSSAAAPEEIQPFNMTSSSLPVPMVNGDLDFQRLMQEYQVITLPNPQPFATDVSLGLPSSAPAVSLSTWVPAATVAAAVDHQSPAAVQVVAMPQVELDGPAMSIHAPSDSGLEQPDVRQPSVQPTVEKTGNREPSPKPRAVAKHASDDRRRGPSTSPRRQRVTSRSRSPRRSSRDGASDRRSGKITLSLDEYRKIMMYGRRRWR